jgi:hypothetical protein
VSENIPGQKSTGEEEEEELVILIVPEQLEGFPPYNDLNA